MAPTSRVTLDGVEYGQQGRTILHSVSLDVCFRRLGIVGRNGSGKSTLAQLLSGVVTAGTACVRINGVDVGRDRRAALFEVGILFQNPDHQLIFPTVIEEMSFGLRQQGMSRSQAQEAAVEALCVFGKEHWRSASISCLSQGQKSLVCLMSVVVMSPRVLILDEPFAGLDIPTRAQLTRYLESYEGDQIHITHRVEDVMNCDQAVWLDDGRVVGAGPAKPVLTRYSARMEAAGRTDDIACLAR